MLQNRGTFGTRKVSPPQPTCMTDDQKGELHSTSAVRTIWNSQSEFLSWRIHYLQERSATYLANLRNNRPARPGGARPLPVRPTAATRENEQTLPRSESALSLRQQETDDNGNKRMSMPQANSMPLTGTLKGRPLVHAPSKNPFLRGGNAPTPVIQQPGEIRFRESESRALEKQEAHAIREKLEQIDHADDETRIYAAAQMEAADLVWKHLNPHLAIQEKSAAYRNPDLNKNRIRLTSSNETIGNQHRHNNSETSITPDPAGDQEPNVEDIKISKRDSRSSTSSEAASALHSNRRRSSGKRTVSNGSSKGMFRNPEDQIYEEPEQIESLATKQESTQDLPLQSRARNSLPRGSRPLPEKPFTVPLPESKKFDLFELHRNPRIQSRNADYTANTATSREATPELEIPKGRAMEIRSDEIRAATSMKRKDRSPKLPTPTAVSDRPGRPIVSFDPSWRPGTESPKTSIDIERTPSKAMPPLPATSRSAPAVPTISLPDDDKPIPSIELPEDENLEPSIRHTTRPSVPTINLPSEDKAAGPTIPSINLPDDPSFQPVPRVNIVSDSKPKPRPLPVHAQSSPAKLPPTGPTRTSRTPWLSRGPTMAGATVTCNACQLSIAGRIVTASGSTPGGPKARFHPECFTCFHCSTALECISFYPEPENAREERLQQDQEANPTEMRFYCHLDYHDLFSPRCASCKTPIEGAVILAAGKSWHEGHFFCAECGDPFSSTSPFVEDKGYAYCVCCHTKRTSARCRACKKQILDEVCVEALGGKWHEECFRCDECAGDFGEDGRFFVREVEVELTEKEKRKGMVAKKFEERAVCHTCEKLRLRRVDVFL